MKLTVSHEFMGWSDYWGGNGRRWDTDAGCVFAFYGKDTTLRDCVDQWLDDFMTGGDFVDGCEAWDKVTAVDLRQAIINSLTEQGRRDYESGALCEGAEVWIDDWEPANDTLQVGDTVRIDGDMIGEVVAFNGSRYEIECDGRNYYRLLEDIELLLEYDDSPVWILLVELEYDDDWDLCQHDDGYFFWEHSDGSKTKSYPNEEAAWADKPF